MLVVMQGAGHRRPGPRRLRTYRAAGISRPPHARRAAHRHRHHRQSGRGRSRRRSKNCPACRRSSASPSPTSWSAATSSPTDTVIRFPGSAATIGGPDLAIIAGPCAIESREQAFAIAERVAACRRPVLPRRRLQASHLALCLPGPGRRGAAHHGRDPRPLRPAHRHRSHGQ